MRLKVRAISAKMEVLEEQGRVLVCERDHYAEQVKARTVDHECLLAELRAALEASDAVTAERDRLKIDRDALAVQQENAIRERDQLARDLDRLRQDAGATLSLAASSHSPVTEETAGQGR